MQLSTKIDNPALAPLKVRYFRATIPFAEVELSEPA
jgi:hypothetical protein